MLKKSEIEEFRKKLLVMRARLRGELEYLTESALDRGEMGSDTKSPTHIAELGTDNYEQDLTLRFVENEQETLAEIEAALQRIEDGTYGLCEMCLQEGKPKSKAAIAKARLRAIPYARNCVHCERKREEQNR